MHEFEGRVYIDKEKLSYKFDLIEQAGKKEGEIFSVSKKTLLNSIYYSQNSLFLSMGSSDSEFREFMRNDKGFIWTCLSEIFKLK